LKEKEAKSAVASSSMEWFLVRICHTGSGTLAPSLWTDEPDLASYSPDVTYGYF
jgi:hypothetical protein